MGAHEQRLRAMQPGESLAIAWYAGADVRRVAKNLNDEQKRTGGTLYYKVYGGCENGYVYKCDWSHEARAERDAGREAKIAQLEALQEGGYIMVEDGEGLHQWRMATIAANRRCGQEARYRIIGRSIIRWREGRTV